MIEADDTPQNSNFLTNFNNIYYGFINNLHGNDVTTE